MFGSMIFGFFEQLKYARILTFSQHNLSGFQQHHTQLTFSVRMSSLRDG